MDKMTERTILIEEELLKSEETYVRDLKILVEIFLEPLGEWIKTTKFIRGKQHPEYCLETVIFEENINVVDQLFADIKLILNYNTFFYEDLKFAISSGGGEHIAVLFKHHAPFMKMYSQYIQKYDNANAFLSRLRSQDSRFEAFVRCCELQKISHGLGMQAFLIMPVQRIPRYTLLLKELAKYAPSQELKQQFEEAMEQTIRSTKTINSSINSAQKNSRLLEIQDMFGMGNLAHPARRLEREGYLTKICHNGRKFDLSLGYYCTAFYFVLCSDLLFYGEELSRLPSATMGVGMGVGRSQTHRVNRTFELKEIRIVMMPSEKDLSFFLLTPTKAFEVECSSSEECHNWINNIITLQSAKVINRPTVARIESNFSRTFNICQMDGKNVVQKCFEIPSTIDFNEPVLCFTDLQDATSGAVAAKQVDSVSSTSDVSLEGERDMRGGGGTSAGAAAAGATSGPKGQRSISTPEGSQDLNRGLEPLRAPAPLPATRVPPSPYQKSFNSSVWDNDIPLVLVPSYPNRSYESVLPSPDYKELRKSFRGDWDESFFVDSSKFPFQNTATTSPAQQACGGTALDVKNGILPISRVEEDDFFDKSIFQNSRATNIKNTNNSSPNRSGSNINQGFILSHSLPSEKGKSSRNSRAVVTNLIDT